MSRKKIKRHLGKTEKRNVGITKKIRQSANEIENIESSDEKLLSIIDELKLKISAKIKSNVFTLRT